MQNGLDRLNNLSKEEARGELLACCGSSVWADEMVARRPFRSRAEVFVAADEIWRGTSRDAWLEAFRSHPQIGDSRSESGAGGQISRSWSTEEQSAAQHRSAEVTERLAAANRAYRERFGYIFIVCATGKTASEMLAILESRLHNDASAELPVAAEEQRRIMQLRLEKLLARQD